MKVLSLLVQIGILIDINAEYIFTCPSDGEWIHRASLVCPVVENYTCQFLVEHGDKPGLEKYTETCRGPYETTPGIFPIISVGNFHHIDCPEDRYQSEKLSTTEGSKCILQKSKCNEEGQVIYSNGSKYEDRTCCCNYAEGYTFVSQDLDNPCFCTPSEEDCSCYQKICGTGLRLSPDYKCVPENQIGGDYNCKEIVPLVEQKEVNFTKPGLELEKEQTKRGKSTAIVCTLLVLLSITCIVLFRTRKKINYCIWSILYKSGIADPFKSPLLDIDDKDHVEGEDIVLCCEMFRDDLPVKWLKGNIEIGADPTYQIVHDGKSHKLIIKEARLSDTVVYSIQFKCRKQNARLQIHECIVKDIKDVTVVEGADACFEVILKGGNTQVKWLKNDEELTTGGTINVERHRTHQTHTLRITRCSLKDKGLYGVKIKDKKRTALLDVKDYYTRNLQDITCTEGDTLILDCEILFSDMSAQWCKDGTCIKVEGRRSIRTEQNCHKMIIEGVEMADSGLYEIDIQGRKRSARLTIESLFTRSLEAMTCIEGECVTFVCEVKTSNTAAKWFQNYNEIKKSTNIALESSERQHKLSIVDTIARDSGEYSVVVGKSKRRANLSVKSYFTKPLDLFTRTVGDTVTFNCEVIEENTTAKWFLNEVEIQQSPDKVYQTSGRQHALVIKNVMVNDGGKYSVIVNGRKSRGALHVEAIGTLQKCELCVSNPKSAVYRCTECKQAICRECTNIHRTQPGYSTHTLVLFCSDYQLKIEKMEDIACLYNREMIIVDRTTQHLILNDITGYNKQYIHLHYKPYELSIIDHNTVAVTTHDKKVVYIVDARKKIVTKQIDIMKPCRRILHRNNYLYVSCDDKSLVVVDMSGEIIRTLRLGFEPWCICCGTDDRICCTDADNDEIVHCIDAEGNQVFTVTSPDMSGTDGITTDHEGHVLVVCCKSNNILKISPDGKQCNVIITDIPSSDYVSCIFYDLVSESIVVGIDDTIYIYKT